MDLNDLKRKVQAARRFTVEVEGRHLVLQRPSDFDLQMAGAKAGLSGGKPDGRLLWERLVICGALVDWTGVVASDFGLEADDTPVPFDAEAVALLLDAQPEWAQQLSLALFAAIAAANHEKSEAEKN